MTGNFSYRDLLPSAGRVPVGTHWTLLPLMQRLEWNAFNSLESNPWPVGDGNWWVNTPLLWTSGGTFSGASSYFPTQFLARRSPVDAVVMFLVSQGTWPQTSLFSFPALWFQLPLNSCLDRDHFQKWTPGTQPLFRHLLSGERYVETCQSETINKKWTHR